MKNRFTIELISDLDFEGMVVEISLGNQVIAQLNYDKGIDKIEMELCSELAEPNLIFPLSEFSHALERAKDILIRCYNEDQINKPDSK